MPQLSSKKKQTTIVLSALNKVYKVMGSLTIQIYIIFPKYLLMSSIF